MFLLSTFFRLKSLFFLCLGLGFSLAITLISPFVYAQSAGPMPISSASKMAGILIDADSMDRDSVHEIMELNGHVQVVYQGQHMKSDRARVNLRARHIDLYGHVEVITATTTIGGEQIMLDYETNTGLIYNGYVQSGTVIFEGSLLEKIGEDEYFVTDANYTACTNCPASWSFSGKTIKAQLGGYAYIKNSVLRFGSLPVFWFPYLVVPLKSDRQSGLLTPDFETSSRGGLAFAQPYFWAIDRNQDATFTLKYYDLRSPKYLFEHRYVPNSESTSYLSGAVIRDQVFKDETRVNTFRPQHQGQALNRWFMRYEHYYTLPEDIIQRVDINLASDLQYATDFTLETGNYGDSAMENKMSLTKNTKDQHYSVEADYYINMLHSDPLSGNDDAVHRLPEMRFSQVAKNVGETDWLYSVDLDYSNFTRSGPAYDELSPVQMVNGVSLRSVKNYCPATNTTNTPTYDQNPNCYRTYSGNFDPNNDLIRTGQRLDFQPSIFRTIKLLDGLDIVPKATFRETHYQLGAGDNPSIDRQYVRGELTNRLTFGRVYGNLDDAKSNRYKHEIQPEVTYTATPWLVQPNKPFFGQNPDAPFTLSNYIGNADTANTSGLQFDSYDRVYDRNQLTLAITNKLVEKRWLNNQPDYRQIMLFRIAQSFDQYQAEHGAEPKQPWSDISGLLGITLDNFDLYSTFNDYPIQSVTNSYFRARAISDAGQFVQVAFSKIYPITPGVADVDRTKRTENYTLSGGVISNFVNLMARFTYDANLNNPQRINSWGYIAQFKPPGDCWRITLMHSQVTGGDATFRFNFDYNFDGTQRGPLSSGTLDTLGI